ncbi:peptidase M23 [Pedobacter lusitanus]|uniref:Contig8, whole genome shotgun sequence n=1 Tax=Pedobacter lusitanus TaxID=1503925 RepID=A0A0D0GN79_9SPHI|nr:peptidoglycan DD-metalloendopeptidase family protein [Pedobacter lusitanus]KIO78662.1 peptidase M23 [Pedobacter lusitanus]
MKLHKLLLFLLFITFASTGFAQSSSQLKRKKEAIQREIELLQKNLNKASQGKKLTLSEIRALSAKISLMQNKITVINSEIKNLDNEIHENKNTVHSLQGQLAQLKKEYAGMIRFAQRNKNSYDKMMFIFAARDFNQAYKRIKYLQQFGQYRKKQADYIQGTEKNLNYKIVVLDKSLKAKSSLLHEQETEQSKLAKNKSEQASVLNKFSKQEKEFGRDIAKRKKQQSAIDREIRNAINREIALARKKAEEEARIAAAKARAESKPAPVEKAKTNSNYLTSTPEAARLSAGFENNRGRLPWPVATGSITEGFGRHTEGQASYSNDGVNIMTSDGANVRAVFGGEVLFVRVIQGIYVVAIRHGDYFTIYQGLKSSGVSKGEKVETRQSIGTVATTSDGAVLHFEIMRGQSKLNPESWIAK